MDMERVNNIMARKKTEPLENTQKETKEKLKKPGKEKKEKTVEKKPKKYREKLSEKEKAFCRAYIKDGNGTQAVKKAGYKYKTENAAGNAAYCLLRKPQIQAEIARLNEKKEVHAIATAQEVMEFFTRCMLGEEKDQFGLDISAADKIKAAQELAKRTIDIDNRIKGIPDQTVSIKLEWQ